MSDEKIPENIQNTAEQPPEQELSEEELKDVSGGGGLDGISYLVAVTQMKANNANDAAMKSKP
jgi:hypothetical protein